MQIKPARAWGGSMPPMISNLSSMPTLTFTVPIAALLLVLLLCARWHPVEVARG